MAFIIRNAAGKLLIVAVCGIGVLQDAGLVNSAEYPLLPLTQNLVRHLDANPAFLRRRAVTSWRVHIRM
jgi:hypothetical protein